MGITNRGGRYGAQGTGLMASVSVARLTPKRKLMTSLLKVRQARAEHKVSGRRNNSGNIDLDFEIAATRTGTVASILGSGVEGRLV